MVALAEHSKVSNCPARPRGVSYYDPTCISDRHGIGLTKEHNGSLLLQSINSALLTTIPENTS